MDALAVNTANGGEGPLAVAGGGTALTGNHLGTLNVAAPLAVRQVIALMDNDPAGDTAAAKAHTVRAAAGVDHPLTLVPLSVKDASQLLQENGSDALRLALADRRPLEDLVADRVEQMHAARWARNEIASPEAGLNVLHSAAPIVAAMTDEQQHRQTLRLAQIKLNLSLFTVMDQIDEYRPPPAPWTPNIRAISACPPCRRHPATPRTTLPRPDPAPSPS